MKAVSKFGVLFLFLVFSCWAQTPKTIITSVPFQDVSGNVVAGGTLVLQLPQDAQIIGGGQVVPKRVVRILLTSGGMIPLNTVLWACDQLLPSGMAYMATVYDQNGNLVYGPQHWVINGISPIDLSLMTPASQSVMYPALVQADIPNTFTAPQNFNAAMNANAGGILNGTFGGNPVFSGTVGFQSVLNAPFLGASSVSTGAADLVSGDATHTGYIEFRNPAAVRYGYIGWDISPGMSFVLERGGSFNFAGGSLNVSSSINSPVIIDSGLTAGNCVQAGTGGLLATVSFPCGSGGGGGGGGGTVTTTGSPLAGNLSCFSGATSITNCDLSGAVTTSGSGLTSLAVNVVAAANIQSGAVGSTQIANGSVGATQMAQQYNKVECSPGLGDGIIAIAAGIYPQFNCANKAGTTWTIIGLTCWTDNNGSSTLTVTNNSGFAILATPIVCNSNKSTAGAGSTFAITTLLAGDALNFSFVSDGITKQTTWTVVFTQ